MRVVYVVDSITDLNKKITLLKTRFVEDIVFVVRADLVELFKTYGYNPNAIYYKNLSKVVHSTLARLNLDDTVICYASLKLDNNLLNNFVNNIGDKSKVVSLEPQYNIFEKFCNATYNIYVKSLFKLKDSMSSPKLQFLPATFVDELLYSHISNRLFELSPEHKKSISVEDKEINKSMKTKSNALKYNLISIIIALLVTVGLFIYIANSKINYVFILLFAILYILDLTLSIIFTCKAKFDQRFLK